MQKLDCRMSINWEMALVVPAKPPGFKPQAEVVKASFNSKKTQQQLSPVFISHFISSVTKIAQPRPKRSLSVTSNKLHLEGQIKAAKLGKCWMYKNTGKVELLLHNAAPGWFLPTSNKDFSSPKKSLFALDLAFATQTAFPAVPRELRSAASSSKSNPTYPVRSWRIRWSFLTWLCLE